ALGPQVDVYSLGAILYETLTGRPPFQGATVDETLKQVRGQEPLPPRRLQPKVPRDLETICLQCLEKEPNRRYKGALQLAEDLDLFPPPRPIQARPASAFYRFRKFARRNPVLVGAVAAILLTVTLGLVGTSIGLARSLRAERQTRALLAASYAQ